MGNNYILGVILAIASGVLNQFGQLLQKKVVNELPKEAREKHFMRALLRSRTWLAGLFIFIGGGTVTYMFAQDLIGPALVPGFMASGLIVLAVGSVKMIGETLDRYEILGIILMISGIFLLGLSELEVSSQRVRDLLLHSGVVFRITVFTLVLFALWISIHLLALRSATGKGIIMGFSNAFPFCLSNFWVSPLLAVMFPVLGGSGTGAQITVFVVAAAILIGCNVLGIRQTQEAFKFGQVSNIIPVQQVPVQITPVLVYFSVFSLEPPKSISGVLIVAGALLIIIAGFLIGRRQTGISASAREKFSKTS